MTSPGVGGLVVIGGEEVVELLVLVGITGGGGANMRGPILDEFYISIS